ncbi:uncharacterized protein LOC131162995 [Malania oleifera]|uniref:uncharacterized protein LOC131162995 n=1 Tax=Malania oleifera TaxID=397392 RepID=UPI0025AE42C4|nr:uncharacterized protein LOC131162995 [Malania oleifera]
MSMLDAFFNKGFKAAKCKTMLKLTMPRIKLLRNRREIQIKQMRRDIAKLLETGQEATARIRVEHIIREENMMAAQEILELFCELISVRLPIIETQRECPLDLKEAISSVCFAAPRCADLPELLQVQMLFVGKYGKEFVSAATELMPDCGVNRQLIELLSIRAPAPDVKLKLLKEIAEEHELDWDPAASETEFFKPHEDLLNGPTQFSGSKLPLPKEKHDELLYSAPDQASAGQKDSDTGFDPLEFPEVPKVTLQPSTDASSVAESVRPSIPTAPPPEVGEESAESSEATERPPPELPSRPELVHERSDVAVGSMENKQFVPFISPPSPSPVPLSVSQSNLPPSLSRTKSEASVDLQDVLAAAHAAAESADRAAAAARSAASLAEVRITELIKKKNDSVSDSVCENPFHGESANQSIDKEKSHMDQQDSLGGWDGVSDTPASHQVHENDQRPESSNHPSYDTTNNAIFDLPLPSDGATEHGSTHHQPQRLTSMEDEYFSYPNLFRSQDSNLGSGVHSFTENTRSTHEL